MPLIEHRTASRVTGLLEIAAAHPRGVTLAQCSAQLSAPRSSIYGLAKGLVANGYLREQDGSYFLGPAASALLSNGDQPLQDVVRPFMRELQGAFDETVTLATLVGETAVYVDTVQSTQPIRYSAPLHIRRPLYPTSSGKCFLAYMQSRRLATYLEKHFGADERVVIEAGLEQVRQDGFAANRGETLPDISAVAGPIWRNRRVTACLSVAGPTPRLADALGEVGTAVRETTERVSRQFGAAP